MLSLPALHQPIRSEDSETKKVARYLFPVIKKVSFENNNEACIGNNKLTDENRNNYKFGNGI